MFEQAGDQFGVPLVANHLPFQCRMNALAVGAPRAILQLCFHGLVEVLVGVEFRGIGRQVEQFDLVRSFRHPFADGRAAVGAQVVHDEEDLMIGIADQSAEEPDEGGDLHGTLVGHEPQVAAVADGGHHVDANLLGHASHHRRLSSGRIPASALVLIAHARLIAP